jgi:hypothetical protein
MLWDGRFTISLKGAVSAAPDDMTLRPLGPDGVRLARAAGIELKKLPRSVLLASPSFWRGGEPVHIPFAETGGAAADRLPAHPDVAFANRDLLFGSALSYSDEP